MAEVGARPDLPYTRHTLTEDDLRAVRVALQSGCIAQGPIARGFETQVARLAGARHATATSSGTTALEMALAALGVGPGDQVVVPTLTFVATANAVRSRGAEPVFADVDPVTLNLSPETLAPCVTDRTVGAIPVHFAGHPADVPGLRKVLGEERFLLEDAAHALGAQLGDRPVGALGDAACFSFHPAKLVSTGEGGAMTTDSEFLDERARMFREHGLVRNSANFEGLGFPEEVEADALGPWVYELQSCGSNHRLSELQAALGCSQLARAHELLARRRVLAEAYHDALASLDAIACPRERPGARSAWHLYPIRVRPGGIGRGRLYRHLRDAGIGVQVHYIPVHLQPYYRNNFGTAYGDCPVAEQAYLELLSLPLFPDMGEEDTYRVVDELRSALGAKKE
ncbi:MAG: DegT/DnrJ/EryC1/StrS family aminotransferase [bacterium]|nr:DegT/DnrJ/EryC1/StrS family aminotransferase [bacterium]